MSYEALKILQKLYKKTSKYSQDIISQFFAFYLSTCTNQFWSNLF